MTLRRLDHVAIRTTRFPELLEFYTSILGLTAGPRPNFPFDGAWLYLGELPVVHLVAVSSTENVASPPVGLEHFAFLGEDESALRAKLAQAGVPYAERTLDEWGLAQLVFRDPDGNRLHVDFPRPLG